MNKAAIDAIHRKLSNGIHEIGQFLMAAPRTMPNRDRASKAYSVLLEARSEIEAEMRKRPFAKPETRTLVDLEYEDGMFEDREREH